MSYYLFIRAEICHCNVHMDYCFVWLYSMYSIASLMTQ